MEFRAFDRGTVLALLAAEGADVVLGQPVAILGQPGEDVSALIAKAAAGRAGKDVVEGEAREAPPTTAPEPATKETPAGAPEGIPEGTRLRASPFVRKLARERDVDLRTLRGTGPHGRIVERDLTAQGAPAATRAPTSSPSPSPSASPRSLRAESRPLSPMRRTIARRMTESKQTVPHFYLTVDLDADALLALRARANDDLAADRGRDDGPPTKLSLTDLLVKACALALRRVPACNASFTPDAIVLHDRVDVAVAVAIEDGLLTPVVRDADQKSVLAIGAELGALSARARARKLAPEETSGGTFSLSNLGMQGIDAFAAVIDPPASAILAVGRARREPVVRGDAIAVGHRLACTLSCDHRAIDGAIGAAFLQELRALIEPPTRLLL
jgi:pyruvate dehydrogenase E2 component (dihydrolipoamide acetyltransferase)